MWSEGENPHLHSSRWIADTGTKAGEVNCRSEPNGKRPQPQRGGWRSTVLAFLVGAGCGGAAVFFVMEHRVIPRPQAGMAQKPKVELPKDSNGEFEIPNKE